MSLDDEHEVIDSPAALFRHLVEAHDLAEARDLDPITTPVHPWLRRHAELERAARLAAARHREGVAPPAVAAPPEPAAPGPPGPAPSRPDGDPAPAGPRRTPQPDPPAQRRDPPDRGAFRDPLVEALARGLGRRGHDEAQVRAAIRAYVSPDGRRGGEDGVRSQLIGPLLDTLAAELTGGHARRGGRPQAAPPRPAPPRPPAPEDDVMALADAVQGGRGGGATRGGAAWPSADGDDDVMAIANALQRPRRRADRVSR